MQNIFPSNEKFTSKDFEKVFSVVTVLVCPTDIPKERVTSVDAEAMPISTPELMENFKFRQTALNTKHTIYTV